MKEKLLKLYTRAQLHRLYRKAFERMTEGDGYQPFGYDWITMQIARPVWYRTIRAIAEAHDVALLTQQAGC